MLRLFPSYNTKIEFNEHFPQKLYAFLFLCQLKVILFLAIFLILSCYTTINMTKQVKMLYFFVLILLKVFFGIKDYLMDVFVSEYHLRQMQRDDVWREQYLKIVLLCFFCFLYRIHIYANLFFNFTSPHNSRDVQLFSM